MTTAFEILSLVKPYDIDKPKRRVGGARDGGYVLADLPISGDVLSFGVGPDVSFEYDLAVSGHRVFLHDHTVMQTPQQHKLFNFSKRGICGEGYSTIELAPLSTHVKEIANLAHDSILKVDIEGFEWEVFASLSPQQLDCFSQIVVEFHWLTSLLKAPNVRLSFVKLNEAFTLFHVHANNCSGLSIVDGLPVPDVLELSYVRSSLISKRASQTIYPTVFDKGNKPDTPDYPLFYFPFLPITASDDDYNLAFTRATSST